jgi:predicted acetyltransferase
VTALTYKLPSPEDAERVLEIERGAYNSTLDDARKWLDSPQLQEQLRGLYAGGKLVSQLQLLSLRVLTGTGAELPCGGLGSVATPPELRRRGYTAALLRHTCDELRAAGTFLCMLYPFKHSFYRRFGWATVVERRRYCGSPELFAPFRRRVGGFERVGAEAIGELDGIYRRALRGRFGPLARDAAWWERHLLWNDRHNYLWRDETGAARAYLLYRIRLEQGKQTLSCREIVALDPLARAQLFGFLADHDSQCEQVVFYAPADAPVSLLFPDPPECTLEGWTMLRLIDVAGALGAYHYPPDAEGRLSIAVTDAWLAHNQGVFALEVAGGRAQCTRLADEAEADLACEVGVLAQLYARHLRPRTAAAFGLLEAHSRPALALAERLFAGLAPYNSDAF